MPLTVAMTKAVVSDVGKQGANVVALLLHFTSFSLSQVDGPSILLMGPRVFCVADNMQYALR